MHYKLGFSPFKVIPSVNDEDVQIMDGQMFDEVAVAS